MELKRETSHDSISFGVCVCVCVWGGGGGGAHGTFNEDTQPEKCKRFKTKIRKSWTQTFMQRMRTHEQKHKFLQ